MVHQCFTPIWNKNLLIYSLNNNNKFTEKHVSYFSKQKNIYIFNTKLSTVKVLRTKNYLLLFWYYFLATSCCITKITWIEISVKPPRHSLNYKLREWSMRIMYYWLLLLSTLRDDQLAANSTAACNFVETLDLSLINHGHKQH